MEGSTHYSFKRNFAKNLSVNEIDCLGRSLCHGHFDRLFSIFSAKAISYNIVTGKEASLRLIRELFMNLLEPQDQNILHKVWSEVTYTSVLILEMAELFSNHSITQLPTRSTVEVLLNSLAQHTICMKPFYYIHT